MLEVFRRLVPVVLSRPLNDVQEQLVVASPSDSLFIVAGPGSGKTTVLALRVLKLAIIDRIDPTTVVATTFTRKAAKELRSRILGWGDRLRERLLAADITEEEKARIRQLDFNAVITGTLDSIAETILGQFRVPGSQPPAVIEEFVARAVLLRHGLFAGRRYLDADLRAYVTAIRGSAFGLNVASITSTLVEIRQRIVHDGVDPTRYGTERRRNCSLCGAHPHLAVPKVLDVIQAYHDFLTSAQVVDYASLEYSFFRELARGALRELSGNLRYVLVDEYQDTNLLQERIYFELARATAANHGGITVVGDDDQSLFRFRGATVDLFQDFPTRLASTLGSTPARVFLTNNYRSTRSIVDFCKSYISLDASFQPGRVSGKPPIRFARQVDHNPRVLGMFRDDVPTLGSNLTSFICDVFHGTGFRLPSGDVIRRHTSGSLGDCALLTHSAREHSTGGNERLPFALRVSLASEPHPSLVFNPRGQALASIQSVRRLCGLMLECIDPAGRVQTQIRNLPTDSVTAMAAWRAAARSWISSHPTPSLRTSLAPFVSAWQRRRSSGRRAWPIDVPLADLAYKLVTWIPEMQGDIEGLVYLEVILRTITESSRFGPYSGSIVFRDPTIEARSIQSAIWDVFVPIATGAVEVDEDLLETLPRDRLNILTIHQSKGLEFPLVVVDVGSDFKKDHPAQRFRRFPDTPDSTHRLEDELRHFSSSLAPPARSGLDRAFDDLIRLYFVAFSRAQDVLLLVGHRNVAHSISNVATGWDRGGTWRWGQGLRNLLHI
jgi:DNA helicase-2/ATP-dependent DNA helicase PcrA